MQKTWKHNKDEMERNITCSICIEDFKMDSQVRVTPCKHVFHDECLMNWLARTI